MWGAYFLNYCDRQAVFSMFPSLKSDLNMTDGQLGLTGTIFLWVYALGCPIAGQLGDRFSKRKLVVMSLIIWSIVTIATGFANSASTMLSLPRRHGDFGIAVYAHRDRSDGKRVFSALRSRAIAVLTIGPDRRHCRREVGSAAGWRISVTGAMPFFVLGAAGLVYAVPYFLFLLRVNEDPVAGRHHTAEQQGQSGWEQAKDLPF